MKNSAKIPGNHTSPQRPGRSPEQPSASRCGDTDGRRRTAAFPFLSLLPYLSALLRTVTPQLTPGIRPLSPISSQHGQGPDDAGFVATSRDRRRKD